MFGFSGEHLLVLLVILLIFGPKRLPDLGHSIGRTLKNFKDAMGGTHQDNASPSQQIASSSNKAAAPKPASEAPPAERVEAQASEAPVSPKA